jgi:hypothetical protein
MILSVLLTTRLSEGISVFLKISSPLLPKPGDDLKSSSLLMYCEDAYFLWPLFIGEEFWLIDATQVGLIGSSVAIFLAKISYWSLSLSTCSGTYLESLLLISVTAILGGCAIFGGLASLVGLAILGGPLKSFVSSYDNVYWFSLFFCDFLRVFVAKSVLELEPSKSFTKYIYLWSSMLKKWAFWSCHCTEGSNWSNYLFWIKLWIYTTKFLMIYLDCKNFCLKSIF